MRGVSFLGYVLALMLILGAIGCALSALYMLLAAIAAGQPQ